MGVLSWNPCLLWQVTPPATDIDRARSECKNTGGWHGPRKWELPQWPLPTAPSSGPLSLPGLGLLPGTCRAGGSGWWGLGGEEPRAGEQSPSRGARDTPISARNSPCPQSPRVAGCWHPTGHPAQPRTPAPTRHCSRVGASAASSLCRRRSAACEPGTAYTAPFIFGQLEPLPQEPPPEPDRSFSTFKGTV